MATFNILHGRSTHDGRVELDRLRAAVRELDADILGLQEVDHLQERSSSADLTSVAAEAMGAGAHRFVAALAGTPGGMWTAVTGDEQPDEACYGVALLSRHPVLSWRTLRLPVLTRLFPMWFRGHKHPVLLHDEPRVAVVAVVDTPTGALSVACTHLSFVPGWNRHQLRRLVRSLEPCRRPLLLMGDLNLEAPAVTRISGMRHLGGAPTFPADRPERQLDHVLLDGTLPPAVRAHALELPLSDHRALVVDL